MHILICCSKRFYGSIPPIKVALEERGHRVDLPNSYEAPLQEEAVKRDGPDAHRAWKAQMIRRHDANIDPVDAILVLNFEKEGAQNYIGGATFLETFKAFEKGKKIFFFNPLPTGLFEDELKAFGIDVIDGDLARIR